MAGRSGGGRSGGGSRGGGRSSSGRSLGSRGSSGRSFSSAGSNRGNLSSRRTGGFGGSLLGGGSSGSGGSFHHSPPPRPPRRSYGGSSGGSFLGGYLLGKATNRSYGQPSRTPYGTNEPYQTRQRGNSGCLSKVILFIALLVILFIVLSIVGKNNNSNNTITPNTIKREALEKGYVTETKYYDDQLDWINNETTLTKGLKNFYNLTGIQPYILLVHTIGKDPSDAEIDDFANAYYDEHFKDEAHLLYLYIEDIDYMYGIVGSAGQTIINQEAWDILYDYIQKYWSSDMDEDSLFSTAFNEAGKSIMSDPNAGTKMKTGTLKTLFLVLGIIVVVAIIRSIYQSKLEQKRQEAKELKDILDKPLESFKDTEMDDLEKKYEDK